MPKNYFPTLLFLAVLACPAVLLAQSSAGIPAAPMMLAQADDGLRFGPAGGGMPPGAATPEPAPQPEEQPSIDYNQPPPDMPVTPQFENPGGVRFPRQSRPAPSRPGGGAPPSPVAELEVTPGPIDRMTALGGGRSLSELVAAVRHAAVPGVEQQPAMAVADGETELRLIFSRLGGGEEPGLVLANLQLERFFRNRGATWVLTAIPEKDAYDATVFVNGPGKVVNVPVLVTPWREVDFDGNGVVDDADLARLRSGAEQGDVDFDLNRDGEFGVADEYIFVANYLLRQDAGTSAGFGPR